MYKLLSGAKAVKQYRGDENLPEAKNGMKNCGCKHPKTKYKRGTKGLTDPPPSKVYDYSYHGIDDTFTLDPYKYKVGNVAGTLNKLTKKSGKENHFVPGHMPSNLNWTKDFPRLDSNGNPIKGTSLYSDLGNPLHVTYHKNGTPNFIYKRGEESDQEAINRGIVETFGLSTPKSRERGTAIFDEEKEKKIIEDYIKRNKYKREDLGYKYGTGAIVIPEKSAIVTANGGKNIQALKAYKQGNYKLLNKIIEQMPEDRVDKADGGKESTKLGGLTSFEIRASKKGKAKNRLDMTKTAQDEIWQGKNYDEKWIPEVEAALKDPKRYEKVLEYFKNYQGQDKETVQRILNLAQNKSPEEVKYAIKKLGTDRNIGPFHTTLREAIKPETPPETPPGTIPIPPPNPPGKTPPDEEYEDVDTGEIRVPRSAMSFGETSAINDVLRRGPVPPTENYLKLERPNFISNLPAVLRDINLSEKEASDAVANMTYGDSSRFLLNKQKLFGTKLKAAADAGTVEAQRNQEVINEGIKIGNLERTTNRNLKDYYDDIKRQNINDYNALEVKQGQSFDESFDTWQKMQNENQLKSQQLQLLKEANPNYTQVWDPRTGTYRSVYRYKRKPVTTQSSPQPSIPPSIKGVSDSTLSGENLDLTTTNPFNPPTMFYKKGIKKAKTYKRK